MTDTTKRCSHCGETKPLTPEFWSRNRAHRDGWTTYCKLCDSLCKSERRKRLNRPPLNDPNVTKVCTKCKEGKPATTEFFSPDPIRPSGLHSWCRRCVTDDGLARQRQNPARVNARQREWVRRNPEMARAQSHNARAKQWRVPGRITGPELKARYEAQEGRCHWCGTPLDDGYEVDHLIPLSKGGANDISNVVCACVRCNASRGAKLPGDWKPPTPVT